MEHKECYDQVIHLLSSALYQTVPENKEHFDLAGIYEIARKHNIANTIYYAVKDMAAESVEPFRKSWLHLAQINAIQDIEVENVLKQLEMERIRCVPLKGHVIKNLYPYPEMRSKSDIDILIDADNMPRITDIMIKSGFVPDDNQGGGNHYSFNKNHVLYIEFHHSLFDLSSPFSEHFNPGWQYTIPGQKDEFILELSKEGFYIYLIAHIANHFISGGTGIRSVMDVFVYNRHFESQLDYDYIGNEFERAGLTRFAQNIKSLSEVWFCGRPGNALTEELGNFIMSSGVFGTLDTSMLSQVLKYSDKNEIHMSKARVFTNIVFLPLKEMQYRYGFLKRFPLLLQIGWGFRAVRVLWTKRDIIQAWIFSLSNVHKDELEKHRDMFRRFGL